MTQPNKLTKQARELMEYDPPFVLIPVKLSINDDGKLEKMPVMKWAAAPIPEKDVLKKLTGRSVNGLAFDLKRSGLVVIDIDAYKDECNWHAWLHETGNEIPDTWMVNTGSGGVHLIFANPDGIQLRGNIAGVEAVDIKSAGIEIIPPSSCGFRDYEWSWGPENMGEGPAPIPQWLLDECAKGTDEQDSPMKLMAALGMREPEENVEILDRLMEVPNDGIGYSEWLMVMMGLHFEFHDTELEPHALDAFYAWTKTRAEGDSTSEDDLRDKWEALPRMGEIQSPYVTIGSVYHFINQFEKPPMIEEEMTALEETLEELAKPAPVERHLPVAYKRQGTSKPRQWVLGTDLIKGEVSALFAKGGSGKSSLVILQALSIATGRPLMGAKVFGKRKVWLWNGEDGMDELIRRIDAAMLHYGITDEELGGRLLLQTSDMQPINIAYETSTQERAAGKDKQKVSIDNAMIDWVIDEAQANDVEVVIFDPFVNTHQLNENDNVHVNVVMQAFKQIARGANMAVQLVHHVAKGSLAGNDKEDRSADAARGATSFINASRVGMALQTATANDAKMIPDGANIYDFVKLVDSKANLASRRSMDNCRWFQKVGVRLNNGTKMYPEGDEVAVMEHYTPTESMISDRHGVLLLVVNALQGEQDRLGTKDDNGDVQGGYVFKNKSNSYWAGYGVAKALGLELGEHTAEDMRADSENDNRARVTQLINEALELKYLAIEDRPKPSGGRPAPAYVPTSEAAERLKALMR